MYKEKIVSYLNRHYIISILLYFLFFDVFYILLTFVVYNVLNTYVSSSKLFLAIAYSFLDLFFAYIILLVAHKIHNICLGFKKDSLFKGVFITGAITIILAMCNVAFTLITPHDRLSDVWLLNLVVYTIMVFATAFYEEILFRGLLLNLCINKSNGKKNNISLAVVMVSVIFSLSHFSSLFDGGLSIGFFIQLPHAFCTSLFFSAIYLKYNNIWIPIILHTINNEVTYVSKIFFIEENVVANTSSMNNSGYYALFAIVNACIFTLPYFIAGVYILKKINKKNVNHVICDNSK